MLAIAGCDFMCSTGDVDGVYELRRIVAVATAEALLLQFLSFRNWTDIWLLVRGRAVICAGVTWPYTVSLTLC